MVINAPPLERQVDRRVTRTQKMIREALKSLLAEKSFEAISVQDIAERATVNRATFYSHFTDKFALLEAIVREHVAALLAEGDPLRIADTRSLLVGVANNVFAFVDSHRDCRIDRDFEPQFKSAIETELTEFLQPTFEHCSAMLVAAALVGSAMNWRLQAPKMDPASIVANIVDILVDGVKRHKS